MTPFYVLLFNVYAPIKAFHIKTIKHTYKDNLDIVPTIFIVLTQVIAKPKFIKLLVSTYFMQMEKWNILMRIKICHNYHYYIKYIKKMHKITLAVLRKNLSSITNIYI